MTKNQEFIANIIHKALKFRSAGLEFLLGLFAIADIHNHTNTASFFFREPCHANQNRDTTAIRA